MNRGAGRRTIFPDDSGSPNRPRAIAMHLAQSLGKYPAVHQLKQAMTADLTLMESVEKLKQMVLGA